MDNNERISSDKEKFIKEEIYFLFSIYYTYDNLYKDYNEKVFNTFPRLFWKIQSVFIDILIIKINNLLESSKSGKNKNLTIETLIENLAEDSYKQNYKNKLNDIKKEAKDLKRIRNKYLSHFDLEEAKELRKEKWNNLKEITNKIENILIELGDLFSSILGKEIIYESLEKEIKMEIDNLFNIIENDFYEISSILPDYSKENIKRAIIQELNSLSPNLLKKYKEIESILNNLFGEQKI